MEIPRYIIAAVLSHLRRIADNVTADPNDHRTRDALRLAAKDINALQRHIDRHDKAGKTERETTRT